MGSSKQWTTGRVMGMPASLCLAGVVALGGCGAQDEEPTDKGELQVRMLFDRTGPTALNTSDALNAGLIDYIESRNATGGVAGYQVRYQEADHQYNGELAKQKYDEFKELDDLDGDGRWDTVVTIFGEGTPDTLAVTADVTSDEIPYFSQAYPGVLAAPEAFSKEVSLDDGSEMQIEVNGSPYNFFVGTDYSTGIRIGMQFVKDRGGAKVAFIGCSNPYCTGPLTAGKTYATGLGLEIAPDQCDPENPTDSCPELGGPQADASFIADRMAEYFESNSDVDWVWVGNLTNTTVPIIQGVHAVAPNVKFIVNVYGFDEAVYSLCGDACVDRVFGVMPFSAYGDTTVPGMASVVDIFDGSSANDEGWRTVRYVQGYVTAYVWAKAVEKVDADGDEVTGPNIKAALETFENLSTGGLTAPISYSGSDHRPNSQARVYSVDANGTMQFEESVSIEKSDDWLGW